MKASFKLVDETDNYILIKDLSNTQQTMSIPNDAEGVIKFLGKYYKIRNKIIYYIDTEGRVDILQHSEEGFIGFKPGYPSLEAFKIQQEYKMTIMQVVKNRLNDFFGENNYHLIMVVIAGSHGYGMAHKDSDFDIQGIVIPPVEYILGVEKFEQIMISKTKLDQSEVEGVIYSFDKWYDLLIQQNPNIVEILWHDKQQYIYKDTDVTPMLMANRDKLLSLKAKHSFAGYAHAQFQRLDKLNEKVNQNKKRLEEFEKFGYSTKNASHMIRLMNTCLEILVEHEVHVMRPERQQLIAIRNGQYTLDEIRNLADTKNALIETAYVTSTLQKRIDPKVANFIKINILKKYLKKYDDE